MWLGISWDILGCQPYSTLQLSVLGYLGTSWDVSHTPDILGHPGMSAILHATAESQVYVSWDILGHPGISAILHTTAESQVYVSWDILGYSGMSAILNTTAESQV